MNSILQVTKTVAQGDLSLQIDVEAKGEILELKEKKKAKRKEKRAAAKKGEADEADGDSEQVEEASEDAA